ncbi:MAG: glycosyltransferase [Cyanobacteria bacterium J06641_5]
MKIAFLVWRFPVLSEAFILNQITGLLDRGHEVHIYALAGRPKGTKKVHPVVEKYNLLERTDYAPERPQNPWLCALKGFWLLLANLHKNSPRCLQMLNFKDCGNATQFWKHFYRAIAFLETDDYDIVHCQFGTLGPIGLTLREAGFLSGKLVTIFRGIDISRHVREEGEDVYQELFAKGDYFLANCEFFRRRAIDLGCDPQRIVVHGSGIDCQKFNFKVRKFPDDGRIRISTIGRLVEKKGIEYAIQAVAWVAQYHPNIEFLIIGDGPLKTRLQYSIDRLGAENFIKLLGWKQQQEIVEILETCHLFVAPSVTAADGNQDAPVNTLKEAMAMGLPVVSTHHGGIPELVDDGTCGFLVPERDAEAIAEKLAYLIEHPELWEVLGKAGRARVEEKYDMNGLNDELVEVYQTLLKSKPLQSGTSALSIQASLA